MERLAPVVGLLLANPVEPVCEANRDGEGHLRAMEKAALAVPGVAELGTLKPPGTLAGSSPKGIR